MALLNCLQIIQQGLQNLNQGLDYARWYWPIHASLVSNQRDAKSKVKPSCFLVPGSNDFTRWSRDVDNKLQKIAFRPKTEVEKRINRSIASPPHPLLIACEWGLEKYSEQILHMHGESTIQSIRNKEGENALYLAALHGHSTIAVQLLDLGMDCNSGGGLHGYALQAALFEGHRDVVGLLLDRGADINAQGGQHGNALQAASNRGHQKIVQVLLERAH